MLVRKPNDTWADRGSGASGAIPRSNRLCEDLSGARHNLIIVSLGSRGATSLYRRPSVCIEQSAACSEHDTENGEATCSPFSWLVLPQFWLCLIFSPGRESDDPAQISILQRCARATKREQSSSLSLGVSGVLTGLGPEAEDLAFTQLPFSHVASAHPASVRSAQ